MKMQKSTINKTMNFYGKKTQKNEGKLKKTFRKFMIASRERKSINSINYLC